MNKSGSAGSQMTMNGPN